MLGDGGRRVVTFFYGCASALKQCDRLLRFLMPTTHSPHTLHALICNNFLIDHALDDRRTVAYLAVGSGCWFIIDNAKLN